MAKYKWDYNDLLDNCQNLQLLLDSNKSSENNDLIIKFLNNYKKMLMLINKKKIDNSSFNNYIRNEVISNNNEEKSDISEEFINLVEPVLDSYSIISEIKSSLKISNHAIHIDNNKLVSSTDLFFKTITNNYIQDKYFEAFNNPYFLNIIYSKKLGNMRGFTLLDPFLEKKYVNIVRNNSLIDLGILPHEMFHYIINNYENGIKNNVVCDLLSEVEGCFADILYSEFFKNHSLNNNDFFKNHAIYSFDYQIRVFITRVLITNSLDENNRINYDSLNKELKKNNINLKINDDNYLVFFKDNGEYLIRYAIGFLIGLDIYYNYLDDKDKAINSLIDIRNCKNISEVLKLFKDNNITYMHDGYKNLKKYIKN